MKTLIKNGRVIDPANKLDKVIDVLIVDGKIEAVSENIDETGVNDVIDATDCYVMPGLIDLHAHFREPGFEHKETLRTGGLAAARGGFTTVCAMPNTRPTMDNVDTLKYVIERANDVSKVNILPIASITAGQEGEFITDVEGLHKNGAVAISEDEHSVANARVFRQAMRLAAQVGIPVFAHCEDKNLKARGVMNAGAKAKELGLFGIMNAVEDTVIARDVMLAENTGVKLHIGHCSTKGSVGLVKFAKDFGINVTAEVTPHHLILTEDDIDGTDANFKITPPLRTKEDVESLKEALKNDVIDVIASDHAPHHRSEKNVAFSEAAFGISAIETAVSLIVSEIVNKGVITPMQMAEKMSYNPAKILGIDKGTLSVGAVADVTIINPELEYVIDTKEFLSLGKNTPFDGRSVKGKVVRTIVAGETVFEYEKI